MKAFILLCVGLACSMLAAPHLNLVESREGDSNVAALTQSKQAYVFMIQERLQQVEMTLTVLSQNDQAELPTAEISNRVTELKILQAKLQQKLQAAKHADERKWRTLKYEIEGWVDRTDELLGADGLRD